uniref:CRAL/TRIO domain-containing protein, putative n=1 Tax=Plasmodium chabaudi adami TaxID=5826 RepID=A0A1D3RW72_PLACE|nr:CRAL/TRIO domain-containing protein, putative [Plasmodium chabaudi adami]
MSDEDTNKYLTEKVLAYNPTPDEIKYYHKTGEKSVRYIFCKQKLDPFEIEKVQGLKDYVRSAIDKEIELAKQSKGPYPQRSYDDIFQKTLFNDDNYVLRFLQGNEFVYDKCYVDILRHLKWREENLPIKREDIKDIINNGYIYIHGRDKSMHPIIVINCKRFITVNTKEVLKVAYYWMEFAIANLFVEGKIEQWRVIIDLSSCSVLNIPVSTLKEISQSLSCNYRSRLSKMLVLSAPFFISGMWHMLKSIIPYNTQQKISITSAEIDKKLLNQVDADQLEKKYGGTCENATSFADPILP